MSSWAGLQRQFNFAGFWCFLDQKPERLLALLDQGGFVVVEVLVDLELQIAQLPALVAEMFVASRELGDCRSFCRSDFAGNHSAILTPGQAGVSMPLIGFSAPAVRFATAGMDLVKGATEEALMTQDLLEQSALAGKEDEQLPPGIRA